MADEYGRRRPRPGSRRGVDFGEVDDEMDEGWEDEPERPRRRPARGGRRSAQRPPAKQAKQGGGLFSRLFGGASPPPRRGGGGGFDFGSLDDGYDDDGGEDGYDEAPRRSARRPRRPKTQGRETLITLCTPVFSYAALLPRDPDGVHPSYTQYRESVLTALNNVESEAANHGIEAEDAREACYALCFFMDEQVAQSEWREKMQWAAEPLGIMRQQDPEGGVNFFRRLEGFGDRQKDLKEVFLVCLAMGYRGRYAEMEATKQAAEIGDIRQKLVRGIRKAPLDKQSELFPEGYRQAAPIEDEMPPPPRWWIWASTGVVALVLVLWFVLWMIAGSISTPIDQDVRGRLGQTVSLNRTGGER